MNFKNKILVIYSVLQIVGTAETSIYAKLRSFLREYLLIFNLCAEALQCGLKLSELRKGGRGIKFFFFDYSASRKINLKIYEY